MTDKELKKLSRFQLLEMLIIQTERADELEKKLEEAEGKLDSRDVQMTVMGSIAEASLQLAGVFEAAQNAADIYMKSVQERCEAIEAEANRIAQEIEEEARQRAEAILEEAVRKAQQMPQSFRQEFCQEAVADVDRDFHQDFTPDFSQGFHPDFDPDYPPEFVQDFSGEFTQDFSRDYTQVPEQKETFWADLDDEDII